MKYLSLFSGIGGFELGIQQAYEDLSASSRKEQGRVERDSSNIKFKQLAVQQPACIGFSEIDKYATQVYNKHFNHKNYGDITKINPRELQDFDLLVGGFPCQSFSIAGKRGGFNDTRGTLFFEIARIIKEKQPRLLLLENVKGLLSHEQGRTFRTIISTLDELGYDCQWQVLNSKNFGVPQNRERVFIIGHLRGTSRPEVFPIGGTTAKDIKVCAELNSETWKKRHECIRRVHDINGISPTIPTGQGGGVMNKIEIINKKGDKKKSQDCAATLTGGGQSGGNHSDMDLLKEKNSVRRLTPKECERLQGFPDNWTEKGIETNELKTDEEGKTWRKIRLISDTQRYKMAGNAVSVPVIKAIVKKLIA